MHSRHFKNAYCVRYGCENPITQTRWEPLLKKMAHRPIKDIQRESIGFSPVFGYLAPELYSHELQNFFFFSLTVEEKKIPRNKLRKRINKMSHEFAQRNGKAIGELSKSDLKIIAEKAETELLASVEPDEIYINAFIDTTKKLLVIDTSSDKVVERVGKWLAKVDPSFKTSTYFDNSVHIFLTQWVYDPVSNLPHKLTLNHEATLQHDDKSRAVFSKQNLESDELISLLNHDKKVIQLSLVYDNKLEFKIKSNGVIQKVKPTDILMGKPEGDFDSAVELLEHDWVIMSNELINLVDWLYDVFKEKAETNATTNNVHPIEKIDQEQMAEELSQAFNS